MGKKAEVTERKEASRASKTTPPPQHVYVVESWKSHVTRKPQGAKEPNESTSCMFFRCMFMYKVLLEFLEFMHPRLLLDSPAIRLHMALAHIR